MEKTDSNNIYEKCVRRNIHVHIHGELERNIT